MITRRNQYSYVTYKQLSTNYQQFGNLDPTCRRAQHTIIQVIYFFHKQVPVNDLTGLLKYLCVNPYKI